ncbi:MAG: hypothetical protein A2X22_00895 [Bacteroidetes bacterium GWF2_49_14]|nr:MAG: hypothetical protein A2X22_00895 [Bacteroidetes bacterium GWF2_49_14]HBB90156.1 hypothetical protein [Bacteroidales bacterium]
MKIAIASKGNSLDSLLDMNFGRCECFIIYDTENKEVEVLSNPNKDALEAAGTTSVQLMAARSVSKIVAGEFGMKIKPLLDSLRIQMIVFNKPETSVRKLISMLNH